MLVVAVGFDVGLIHASIVKEFTAAASAVLAEDSRY